MSNWQSIYLSSQGRLARLPYFGYSLLLGVLYFAVVAVLGMVLGVAGLFIGVALYLVLVLPFYNLMAKRLQDFGKPGKYAWGVIAIGVLGMLLSMSASMTGIGSLFSLLQLLLALLILFLPGTAGENEYGPQPA
ncbi:MAG: DUF805 domain-containing protein [Proteobacteria bacterium]|nr:DUF805 domain-containing protein [Pseudomonadota bacterium]